MCTVCVQVPAKARRGFNILDLELQVKCEPPAVAAVNSQDLCKSERSQALHHHSGWGLAALMSPFFPLEKQENIPMGIIY